MCLRRLLDLFAIKFLTVDKCVIDLNTNIIIFKKLSDVNSLSNIVFLTTSNKRIVDGIPSMQKSYTTIGIFSDKTLGKHPMSYASYQ